jgi:hypothetical protein
MNKYKVFFKRKGMKDILTGDSYIIEAKSPIEARKIVRGYLKERFCPIDMPRICWINEYNPESKSWEIIY